MISKYKEVGKRKVKEKKLKWLNGEKYERLFLSACSSIGVFVTFDFFVSHSDVLYNPVGLLNFLDKDSVFLNSILSYASNNIVPFVTIVPTSMYISNLIISIAKSRSESLKDEEINYKSLKYKYMYRSLIWSGLVSVGGASFVGLYSKFVMGLTSQIDMYTKIGWFMMPVLTVIVSSIGWRELIFGYKKILRNRILRKNKAKKEYLDEYNYNVSSIKSSYLNQIRELKFKYKGLGYTYEVCDKNIFKYSSNNGNKPVLLKLDGKKYCFKNKDEGYKYCTNKEKIKYLEETIKNMTNLYSTGNNLGSLVCCLEDKYDKYLSSNCINKFLGEKYSGLIPPEFTSNIKSDLSELVLYRDEIINDFKLYLEERKSYIEKQKNLAEKGCIGEERVNKEIDSMFITYKNISGKYIDLSKYDYVKASHRAEIDNIVINRNGIFVLEVKNIRDTSKSKRKNKGKENENIKEDEYQLQIEEDGTWICLKNGEKDEKYSWDKIPHIQNREHAEYLEQIINTELGYEDDSKEYIKPINIIVIGNENIQLVNKCKNVRLCKYNMLNDLLSEDNGNKLTKESMKKIADLIDSIECEPRRYPVIDVYKELVEIEKYLEKIVTDDSILEKYMFEVTEVLNRYSSDIANEKAVYSSKMNSIKGGDDCEV